MPVLLPLIAVPVSILRGSNSPPFLGWFIFHWIHFLTAYWAAWAHQRARQASTRPVQRKQQGWEQKCPFWYQQSIRFGSVAMWYHSLRLVSSVKQGGLTTLLRSLQTLLLPLPSFAELFSVLEKCREKNCHEGTFIATSLPPCFCSSCSSPVSAIYPSWNLSAVILCTPGDLVLPSHKQLLTSRNTLLIQDLFPCKHTAQARQTNTGLLSQDKLGKKYYTIHKTCALLTKTIMGILFLQPCLWVLVSFQYRANALKPGPNNNRVCINLKPAMEGTFLYSYSNDQGLSYCEGQKYRAVFILWCGLIIYTVELIKITR